MHGGGWHMTTRSGDEKPRVTREFLLRVLAYAKPYWSQISGMLLTLGSVFVLPLFYLIAHIHRLVFFHRDRVIRIENVPIW